jgi:hypothetical protein
MYFQLARKYHPDTNSDKGAQDKFVEIQAAYDVSHVIFLCIQMETDLPAGFKRRQETSNV